MSEIREALDVMDAAQAAYGSTVDRYVTACSLESLLRKAARARPERMLPEWIEDELIGYVAELNQAMDAAHAEYDAKSKAWRKLAGLG